MLKAVEFFSGIGAFRVAAHRFDIEVAAAFDQSERANQVYRLNFHYTPSARNLDTIDSSCIPVADLWWLSPPCTPFTRRGKQKDAADQRARSFLRLIELIGLVKPRYICIENVGGFVGSEVHGRLLRVLQASGYQACEFDLCSTAFGTPMRRPRHFVLASQSPLAVPSLPDREVDRPLRSYLTNQRCAQTSAEELMASHQEVARYGASYDVVDPLRDDAVAICFTSGYGKSQKVSGSLIKCEGDSGRLRRFSPDEILALMGFPCEYQFPKDLSLIARWRLLGNSVDVRCVEFCLQTLLVRHGVNT
jgi:site-specific DNA-cytosine methylase